MAYHSSLELVSDTPPAVSCEDDHHCTVSDEPVEDRLKRLSSYLTTIINTRDFSGQRADVQELVSCIAGDWTASLDTQPQKVCWPEQLKLWKARSDELPDVRFEVKHIEMDLNGKKGLATAWIEMDVTGMGGVVLGAMNEVRWRRVDDDKWECFHTRGMRGSPSSGTGGLG